MVAWYAWAGFCVLIAGLVLIDLFGFQRKAHEMAPREAAVGAAMWMALGLSFTFVIWAWLGGRYATEYLSGYLVELSLSVDNVFVFALILGYFAVPAAYRHRVLFWGIFGALVLRMAAILTGVRLLNRFEWMIFVFGGFLLYTAWKMLTHSGVELHPDENPVIRVVRRFVPMTRDYEEAKLFARVDGRLLATPLFAVLVMIETSDLIFAADSIPAVLAVTRHTFIAFASNAFAILGLRALYFLLSGGLDRLHHLDTGVAAILGFVGAKMLLAHVVEIPVWLSLAVIATIMAISVIASLLVPPDGTGDAEGSPRTGMFAGMRERRRRRETDSR
jgi:TerC family integral membrane protein